jgi:hypothetical protein
MTKTSRTVVLIGLIAFGFYWLITHVECAQALYSLSFTHISRMCL